MALPPPLEEDAASTGWRLERPLGLSPPPRGQFDDFQRPPQGRQARVEVRR